MDSFVTSSGTAHQDGPTGGDWSGGMAPSLSALLLGADGKGVRLCGRGRRWEKWVRSWLWVPSSRRCLPSRAPGGDVADMGFCVGLNDKLLSALTDEDRRATLLRFL